MKFLLWLVIACLVVAWLKKAKKSEKVVATATTASGEKMIACAHCGLHVPVSESVTNFSGAAFCGEEHRRLGVRS